MNELKFLFRADNTNVGDWWCPPFKYFPFRPGDVGDILDPSFSLKNTEILILGGGGIGADFFQPHLDRVKSAEIPTTILWGAGVDTITDKVKLLETENPDLYGNFFDFFSEKGIRVYSEPQKFAYVPCASCMNNLFFKYRDVKPTKPFGFYNHKRVTLVNKENPNNISVEDNSGNDLEEKLKFISSCEYIITNTYHGVYWATLLERKVIVIPYKSGLLSFKHKPVYCWDGNITDELMHQAKTYSGALEESRKINLDFYKYLTGKYHLV